ARVHRRLVLRVSGAASPPVWEGGCLRFRVALPPQGTWAARVDWLPEGDGLPAPPRDPEEGVRAPARRTRRFLDRAASFTAPGAGTRTAVVTGALEQARQDLAA